MKLFQIFTALVFAAGMAVFGLTVFASQVTYDISEGSVVLDSAVTDDIIITGTSDKNTVSVKGGEYNIVLRDVSIDVSKIQNTGAFVIDSDANVRFSLEGENTLKSGVNYAGLQLNTVSGAYGSVTIGGTGSLSAYGGDNAAGIGGGNMKRNGSVTIVGGTVYAEGKAGGAGIGGGNNGSSYKSTDGGIITITGGKVSAYGIGGAAGIGGGNHGDGGVITIGGNAVVEIAKGDGGGAGIGSGIGSSKGADKGPGHVNGGTIVIEGNCVIKNAIGVWNGAGIGGGMYSDSGDVTISGGTIELAQGGDGTAGSLHHGAAGIGAGYQGHSTITINGGLIKSAVGAYSGAGIGSGPVANTDKRPNKSLGALTTVDITGGTIELAQGGAYGGAGIGAGFAADNCTVNISGGRIYAAGAVCSESDKQGGAGIGSGNATIAKYKHTTNVSVNITGGEVISVGGWGASAIGSGAANKTADNVEISGDAVVTAFADGTKFAVDTANGAVVRDSFGTNVLQGTYTLPYRAMNTSVVLGEKTVRTLALPDGYRSFAVTVDDEGEYMIESENRIFAVKPQNASENDEQGSDNAYRFAVDVSTLSDNYYLYPISDDLIAGTGNASRIEIRPPYVLSNSYAYIFGRSSSKMEPNAPIIRGEACSVLYRLLKQNNRLGDFVYDSGAEPVFEGTMGRWDRSAGEYAAYVGVYPTENEEHRKLDFSAPITRQEAFKMFAIELGITDRTDLSYEQYAQIMVDCEYVVGYEDGSLRLDKNITRTEFCKIYNLITGRDSAKLETADGTPITAETYGFTDIDDFWGTDVILKATSAYDDDGNVDISRRAARNELDDYDE